MKSLLPLAAAAALFLGFSAPASAELPLLKKIGPWQITADDTLCAAYADFTNTRLMFVINAHGVGTIGITNEKWRIPEGSYEVVMQVDGALSATYEAKADAGHVYWKIPLTEESINLLSYGRHLYVKVGEEIHKYDLTMSRAMLKALTRCATPFMASGNPFSGSPPAAIKETPASTETPSNPFRRL
jgi:hypothetical protein